MAIWMSASFAAFVAPIVVLSFLWPSGVTNLHMLVIVPIAFALGFLFRSSSLDSRLLTSTRRLRSVRPAALALLYGMALISPLAVFGVIAILLDDGLVPAALAWAALTPLSTGGIAVLVLRLMWPEEKAASPSNSGDKGQ
jgi:hypothetical protein